MRLEIGNTLNSALSEFNIIFDAVKELYLDRIKGFFGEKYTEEKEFEVAVVEKLLQLTNFRIRSEIGKLQDQLELGNDPILADRLSDLEYCVEHSILLYSLRDKY